MVHKSGEKKKKGWKPHLRHSLFKAQIFGGPLSSQRLHGAMIWGNLCWDLTRRLHSPRAGWRCWVYALRHTVFIFQGNVPNFAKRGKRKDFQGQIGKCISYGDLRPACDSQRGFGEMCIILFHFKTPRAEFCCPCDILWWDLTIIKAAQAKNGCWDFQKCWVKAALVQRVAASVFPPRSPFVSSAGPSHCD